MKFTQIFYFCFLLIIALIFLNFNIYIRLPKKNFNLKNGNLMEFKNISFKVDFKSDIKFPSINNVIIQNKINGCTILTATNHGYRNFTLNWIKHLEKLNFKKFVVFCFDKEVFKFLKDKGYETRIAMVPNGWLDFGVSKLFSTWASKDYNHIVQSKTFIWYHLLRLKHNILFSDSDVVWLNKNILKHLDFVFKYSYADILFSQDNQEGTLYYNTGFFFAKSTKYTINLFLTIIQMQRRDPDNAMEQIILNNMLRTNKFKDSRLVGLDPFLYSSGKVFFILKLNSEMSIHPFTVHPNYLVGQEKITALKSNNMWLI